MEGRSPGHSQLANVNIYRIFFFRFVSTISFKSCWAQIGMCKLDFMTSLNAEVGEQNDIMYVSSAITANKKGDKINDITAKIQFPFLIGRACSDNMVESNPEYQHRLMSSKIRDSWV